MSQIGFNPSTSSYKGANSKVSQNPNNAQRFGKGASLLKPVQAEVEKVRINAAEKHNDSFTNLQKMFSGMISKIFGAPKTAEGQRLVKQNQQEYQSFIKNAGQMD